MEMTYAGWSSFQIEKKFGISPVGSVFVTWGSILDKDSSERRLRMVFACLYVVIDPEVDLIKDCYLAADLRPSEKW